jgi:hypothetical protein
MKRVAFQLLGVAILFTPGLTLYSQTSQPPHLRRHWTETETETLWRIRYTNCDYGYYVLLGSGVVGHDTLPPAPNHGFVISLPDAGRTSPTTDKEERFVWVDASYDVIDDQSLAGAVSDEEQTMENVRGKSRIVERKSTKLAGLQAILSRVEYPSPSGTVVEETIIAVRSGIKYTIGLRTILEDRSIDEEQFQKVINGFRMLKLPRGQCSNG